MAQLSTVPAQAEPRFLRDNWKMVMAHPESRSYLRVVRICDGTATIRTKSVLIRAPAPVPDGFYLLSEQNELVLQREPDLYQGFPDPLGSWQPFGDMRPSEPILPAQTTALIQYLEQVRSRKVNVVLDKWGFIPVCRYGMSAQNNEQAPFVLNQELPLSGAELVLNPLNLKLALIEMLRYPNFHLWHFPRMDRETPLVLGHGWNNCALVMPVPQ